MKPNELRVGNYVYPNQAVRIYANIREIKRATVMFTDYLEVDIDSLVPIPLTEELLLKCGFEKSGLPRWDMRFMYKKQSVVFCVCFFAEPDRLPEVKFGMMSREINSLHQLQNLYFALTGEELEIKL